MGGEWQTLSLAEVYDFSSGLSKPRSEFGSGHLFLSFKDVFYNSAVPKQLTELVQSTEQEQARCSVMRGDVFLTRTSKTMDELGMSCVALADIPDATFNGFTKRLRPKRKLIAPEFARYFFRSSVFRAAVNSMSTMSTRASLNNEMLERLTITFPKYVEQEAIAHILGTLDDKIELNRRRNQTLEAMARTLFKDWFVDFGPVRAKMEGRDGQDGLVSGQRHGGRASGPTEPYLPADLWQLFPDRLDDEGKPEGWNYRPVGEFAEFKGGKQLEKERISPTGQVPVFGGAGIMGYTDSHNADGFVIAVGRVGAYCGQFFAHRGKAWINNNASLIRQTDNTLAEWLFLALRHTDIDVIKKGAAQPFVSNSDIAKLPLVWPGDNLARVFTDVVSPMQKKKDQHDAESSSLAQLRDTLLPKLISGELRIADAERFLETHR